MILVHKLRCRGGKKRRVLEVVFVADDERLVRKLYQKLREEDGLIVHVREPDQANRTIWVNRPTIRLSAEELSLILGKLPFVKVLLALPSDPLAGES